MASTTIVNPTTSSTRGDDLACDGHQSDGEVGEIGTSVRGIVHGTSVVVTES